LPLFAMIFPSVGMYSPTCGVSERHLANMHITQLGHAL
jgi:hypothetical protein